jgi:flagella synthesis protein FlgN
VSALLLRWLTEERAATADFISLLDREVQAMSSGDFSALPPLAGQKSLLAERISWLTRQREAEQLAMGYTADGSGAQACAAAGGPALSQAWSGLRACAALAREHNHRNGVMIHVHLDFTRQSIDFLQARGHPLYGPDGSHHAGAASGNRLAVG